VELAKGGDALWQGWSPQASEKVMATYRQVYDNHIKGKV